MKILIFLAVSLVLAALPTLAASLDLKKGDDVVLTIPRCQLVQRGHSGWTGASFYTADLSIRLPQCGFPLMRQYTFEKQEVKNGSAVLVFRTAQRRSVKVAFPNGGKLDLLLWKGSLSDYELSSNFRDEYSQEMSKIFSGNAAEIGPSSKLTMLDAVDFDESRIGITQFKDNAYLRLNLQSDGNVYNDLQMAQVARVARATNEMVLPLIKLVAESVDKANVYGLSFNAKILHKSFLDEAAANQTDVIDIYMPSQLGRKFANWILRAKT